MILLEWWRIRFIRYFVVAVSAYGVDFGGFWLLITFGHFGVGISNLIVKVCAAVYGFFAHRHLTYQIRDGAGAGSHALKYFGLALCYAPASTAVLFVLLPLLRYPLLTKFVADALLYVDTYAVTSRYVFTRRKATSAKVGGSGP